MIKKLLRCYMISKHTFYYYDWNGYGIYIFILAYHIITQNDYKYYHI